MGNPLVGELFDGPLDIAGDVHGEHDALEQLLDRLGYDANGHHPAGRRLVFVGDLVDRGQDSPAVVERVAELVASGRAQCVLGNHELNLLLDQSKEGNGWFYPEESDHDAPSGHFQGRPRASDAQRREFSTWFASLPLGLERPDLRVVHACWHPPAIERLRLERRSVSEAYTLYASEVKEQLLSSGAHEDRARELEDWGAQLADPQACVPLLPGIAAVDAASKTRNAIKAVTSGIEQMTAEPFYGGGKWRMTERVAWWREYDDATPVVFGHYWRWAGDEATATARSRGPNLFEGSGPRDWLPSAECHMC